MQDFSVHGTHAVLKFSHTHHYMFYHLSCKPQHCLRGMAAQSSCSWLTFPCASLLAHWQQPGIPALPEIPNGRASERGMKNWIYPVYPSLGRLHFPGKSTLEDVHMSVIHSIWGIQRNSYRLWWGKRVQAWKEEIHKCLRGQAWYKLCSMFWGLDFGKESRETSAKCAHDSVVKDIFSK